MTSTNGASFAERTLIARSKDNATEKTITMKIGVPYWFEQGVEARCPVEIDGPNGQAMDIRGIDPIDALRNTLTLIEKLLDGAQVDNDLFWPDGEPYES